MMGITGLKYMEILGGTNESKQLKEHSEIPAKQSFIASITGKSEVIIAKIELLLNHLNAITHPDSLKSIKKILSNVEGITGTTDKFMDDITPDVKQITASVKSTLKKVDMISSDIRTVTGGISDSLDLGQLTQIIPMIDSSVQSMKSLTENLDMTIKQSREDFAVGLENLREALENANELTKVLLENPSLIIRSETQKERRIQ